MLNVIFYSLVGGIVSLIGGILLLRKKSLAEVLAKYATPFAAGVLLATAFGDLLPESLEKTEENKAVMLAALGGILGFFMLERFLRWFHHHHEHEGKEKASSSLIIIGDTLHNALDGIAIGAAFLIDTPTGIITTAAVATHEIPQEIGDFSLLLKNGMKKSTVLLANLMSALATTATAMIVFQIGDSKDFPLPALLAITAGFFIYIATSDIIPEIHEKLKDNSVDFRPWLLLLGVGIILVISPITHDYIDNHADGDTGHATTMHLDYVLPDGAPIPVVTLHATRNETGMNLQIIVENFTFTPENEGNDSVANEGHTHLYINGEKITRIYGEWTFIPAVLLPEDFSEITVSLSNNNHSEYHLSSGESIGTTIRLDGSSIVEDESYHDDEDAPGHMHP